MSYARFGCTGSDVYVFRCVDAGLECCGCKLQKREWVDDPSTPLFGGYFKALDPIIRHDRFTTDEMVAHLRAHEAAGHTVPSDVYAALEADRDENDAYHAKHNDSVVQSLLVPDEAATA